MTANCTSHMRLPAASPARQRPAARGSHRSALTTTRGSKMRLGFKIVMVLGLTLAILVPLMMIRGVIHEREGYRAEAVAKVARSTAGRRSEEPTSELQSLMRIPYAVVCLKKK